MDIIVVADEERGPEEREESFFGHLIIPSKARERPEFHEFTIKIVVTIFISGLLTEMPQTKA